jgi:choline dehydrogenase-like flavoprotein
MSAQFDAIVIGSGITGGWAAKELTEKGLKVLMIERGRHIEHVKDYTTETKAPWEMPFRGFGDQAILEGDYRVQRQARSFDEWTQAHFVNDREHPYFTAPDQPFNWFRGYQLGGRSLIWGRQSYRWSDLDFAANKRDGHGVDWPVRYKELAPWYDHVEEFIGVSGSHEDLPQLPDGQFQPAMALNVVEAEAKRRIEAAYNDRKLIIGRVANLTAGKIGRAPCQYRSICARGCSYGAYFSTQSSTLPAARATGNLTLVTDQVVSSVDYDPNTKRVTGVRAWDNQARRSVAYSAKIVFLCAGSFNSVAVLLRSASPYFPHGLANSSGVLGHYIMDHPNTLSGLGSIPNYQQHTYLGNRPTGIVIPRFRNVTNPDSRFLRGYSFQGGAFQRGWPRGETVAGIGKDLKTRLRAPGPWQFAFVGFGECLPRAENRISLHPTAKDSSGMAQLHIQFSFGANEQALLADAAEEAKKMLSLMGSTPEVSFAKPGIPGTSIHEMGGARMGHDPATSVLNAHNQTHDIPNLFVTDGACMSSSACQNPSLTYMAFTARAAEFAVTALKSGSL